MQAIEVKFIGPTNSHGARMVASYGKGVVNSIKVGYDHKVSDRDNAAYAAMALVRKLTLNCGEAYWVCSETREGWVFVASNADQFTRWAFVEPK